MATRRSKVVLVAVSSKVTLGAVEGALRWIGRAPVHRSTGWSRSTLVADDRLGYVTTAGTSDIDFRGGPLVRSVRVTRIEGGRRITRPLAEYANGPPRPQIWVFGCSFTFGVLLADEQTFPWIVQTQLPEYDVVNFGVPGYSTLQMLILLQEALKRPDRPAVVVLTYATFHEQRNVCSRAWRTAGSGIPFRYPCARLGPDAALTLLMIDRTEPKLPLADHLAVVGTLEAALNRLEERRLHASDVTERLIREFVPVCRRENIRVVIADLFEDGRGLPMLQRLASDGVPVLSIAPNYDLPGMTFAPFDPHPAPDGARWMGERLATGLREVTR